MLKKSVLSVWVAAAADVATEKVAVLAVMQKGL
jgi:hypothetical protein